MYTAKLYLSNLIKTLIFHTMVGYVLFQYKGGANILFEVKNNSNNNGIWTYVVY